MTQGVQTPVEKTISLIEAKKYTQAANNALDNKLAAGNIYEFVTNEFYRYNIHDMKNFLIQYELELLRRLSK